MKHRSSLAWSFVALTLMVAGLPAQGQAQTAQTCLASQTRYAGTICRGIGKCWVKSLRRGVPMQPGCLESRSAELISRFDSVEATDNCLTEPAGDTVDPMLQDAMSDAASALMPYPGRCGGKKIGAIGRACKQLLSCYSDAAAHSSMVDGGCLSSAQATVAMQFSRFESRETCLTNGDAATLSNDIAAVVDDIYTFLRGTGTTTTSTTTTSLSTTTSTLAQTCPEDGSFTPCTAYRDNLACKECVDAAVETVPETICAGAASQACTNAINNASCGYAINQSTDCSLTCCP